MSKQPKKKYVEKIQPTQPITHNPAIIDPPTQTHKEQILKQQPPKTKPNNKPRYVEKVTGDQPKPVEVEKELTKTDLKKEHKNAPRKFRSKRFNWNPYKVNLDTPIPDRPKVLLIKPDVAALDAKIDQIKSTIKKLKDERNLKRKLLKQEINSVKNEKKDHKRVYSATSTKLRQIIQEKILIRNTFYQILDKQKASIAKLKELRSLEMEFKNGHSYNSQSAAELKKSKQELEHILITKQLTKQKAKAVKDQINQIDRALVNAKDQMQIQLERVKNNDLIIIEQQHLNKVSAELKIYKTKLNEIEADIKNHETIIKNEEKTVELVKNPIEIKQQYEDQIEKITDQIWNLEDQIDSLEETYDIEFKDYQEQQELIQYIEFVENEKNLIRQENAKIQRIEQEKRKQNQKRKKQREAQLKEKQKKKEEYQKLKKQREQRDKKFEQQKNKVLLSLPYEEEKRLCNFLIDYCQRLLPKQSMQNNNQDNTKATIVLKGGEWDKETKKGAHLIKGKKQFDHDLVVGAKQEKKKPVFQKPIQRELLDHHIQIIRSFQSFKVLPPSKVSDIPSTIELIKSKFQYFNNPSEEDIAAHRKKIADEFERGKRYEPKDNGPTQNKQPKKNRVLQSSDFPDIE